MRATKRSRVHVTANDVQRCRWQSRRRLTSMSATAYRLAVTQRRGELPRAYQGADHAGVSIDYHHQRRQPKPNRGKPPGVLADDVIQLACQLLSSCAASTSSAAEQRSSSHLHPPQPPVRAEGSALDDMSVRSAVGIIDGSPAIGAVCGERDSSITDIQTVVQIPSRDPVAASGRHVSANVQIEAAITQEETQVHRRPSRQYTALAFLF